MSTVTLSPIAQARQERAEQQAMTVKIRAAILDHVGSTDGASQSIDTVSALHGLDPVLVQREFWFLSLSGEIVELPNYAGYVLSAV